MREIAAAYGEAAAEASSKAHKYYYNDGETYRFFQQPQALHGPAFPVATAAVVPGMMGPSAVRARPMVLGNPSFPTSEGCAAAAAGSGDMMGFFEGLMEHRFVKMEQDRMIREEAWRRLEMARLAREQEILAQQRAMEATRDASMLSFMQKITRQTIPMPYMPPPPSSSQTHATPIAYAAAAPPSSQPLPLVAHQSSTDHGSGSGGGAASSSRWLKAEEHALIQLRCDMYMRGKGGRGRRRRGCAPLWDEISAGMRRMGYSRSSQRCREKWNNMNDYFNKVKKSKTMRPEDSKTFYRFHQLEAFHRYKAALGSPAGAGGAAAEHAPNAAPRDRIEAFTVAAPMSQMAPQPHPLPHVDRNGGDGHDVGGVSGGMQLKMQASNRFVVSEAGGRAAVKKVIKLEANVHSRVATGGTYLTPTADDMSPEHAQMIDLNQPPVEAKVNPEHVEVQRRADSTSGFRGVRPYGGKYYLAQIMVPGRPTTRQHLGIFDTVEEATRAYDAAALRLYGAAVKTSSEQEQPPKGATADELQEPAECQQQFDAFVKKMGFTGVVA